MYTLSLYLFIGCHWGMLPHVFTFHLSSFAVCFFLCLFGRDLFFPAFSLDSSQTNVASGSHAEVKAALLWVNGSAFSCLQYPITVWLPVILQSWHSSSVRFIWLPHASKEYFTLKIFLNFYMTLKYNEQSDQSTTLWWNACYFSYIKQTAANLRNMVSSYFRMN